MTLARVDDARCLPFAPPSLPDRCVLISDYLIPWGPHALGWFEYSGGDSYTFSHNVTEAREIDIGFYLGHSVSSHFGHFIGDCLCRMYAWQLCRQLFGDVKLILDANTPGVRFRERLLEAAGVDRRDIVFAEGGIRCGKLLLASPSLGVARFASPTSASLWHEMRDGFAAGRPMERSQRVYLSRSRQSARKLLNEPEVEDLFRLIGFQVVQPEDLSIDDQIRLVSGAEFIAGPGGSAMYNIAFQGSLKSILILAPETFVQVTEWLFLAGTGCTTFVHIGTRDMPADAPVTGADAWRVDLPRLTSDVLAWLSQA